MDEPPKLPQDEGSLPPELRWLKRLVTILTITMIAGVITVIALLVIRLGQTGPAALEIPGPYALPAGTTAVSYGLLADRVIVVGTDGVAYVFEPGAAPPLSATPLPME